MASTRQTVPLPALITFAVALSVYAVTLAPGLTLAHYGGDGGELIAAAVTLGVPHPQGYPSYVLLGKLASLIPIGTVAYRFNLFSAVCIAGAAALLTQITRRESRSDIAAIALGLTFAFARLVWSQALIAEVYGLNLLVLALLIWACQRRSSPLLLGLLWGFSLTTHLTSLLIFPFVLWATQAKQPLRFACGVALGLLPFGALPFLASGDSAVVWSDPTTLQGWWWLVSGRIYRPNVFSHTPFPRLLTHGIAILRQFAFVGWIAVGYCFWRGDFRPKTLLYLSTALLYGVYAFSYDTVDFAVFALPALLLLSPLLATGYERLGAWSLAIPLLAIALSFNAVNLHDDTQTDVQARTLLGQMPANAILLTPGDETIFTLWYLQEAETVRLDVTLVDQNLFAFNWYRDRLKALHPTLNALTVDDLDAFQHENKSFRPICTMSITSNGTAVCSGIFQ
ncbi:MAG: DUF2723 domain-containing protein [Candidatus Promineifilaceae bacterium]